MRMRGAFMLLYSWIARSSAAGVGEQHAPTLRLKHLLNLGPVTRVTKKKHAPTPGHVEGVSGLRIQEHARTTHGPDVTRKEAWSFYRTISGVRLWWELEEPKGPKCACGARARESGDLLPTSQRQRRTCYALCHILYPV